MTEKNKSGEKDEIQNESANQTNSKKTNSYWDNYGRLMFQHFAVFTLACAFVIAVIQINKIQLAKYELLMQKRELCKQTVSELGMIDLLGQHYFFSSYSAASNWTVADTFCKSHGLEMVSIASQEENDAITAQVQKLDIGWGIMWLGANDIDTEGDWRWTNGPIQYTNWHVETDQPNGGIKENCACLFSDTEGFWFDFKCNNTFPYICHLKQPCDALVL